MANLKMQIVKQAFAEANDVPKLHGSFADTVCENSQMRVPKSHSNFVDAK